MTDSVVKTRRDLLTMRLVACAVDEITADPQLAKMWVGTVVHSGFVGYESMDNEELLDEAERFGLKDDVPTLAELDIEEQRIGALIESRRFILNLLLGSEN